MKPSLNRTTIFKLIVHGIELHAAFEKRENKKTNAKFSFKNLELSFFSHKIAFLKKDNSKLNNVFKHKWLVTMFTNRVISALFIVQSFPKWFVHFWMIFCKSSIRISCQIIFVNKHWPQLCPSHFNCSAKHIHEYGPSEKLDPSIMQCGSNLHPKDLEPRPRTLVISTGP